MPTKSELETQVNERLDTDMDWSEMKKDDLVKFREGLEDERFVKRVVAQFANDKAGNTVEEQIDGWEPGSLLSLVGQAQNGEMNPADLLYNL